MEQLAKMTGVMCDKKIPPRVKGKLYKTVIRPAMLYGMEAVAVTKAQERQMEVAEMKMLRFSLGLTKYERQMTISENSCKWTY